jgi:hypothetical protein
MRISLTVNGNLCVTAAIYTPGYLSAHLNAHDRPNDNDYSKRIRISGIQTLATETVYSDWPEFDLQLGDTVELRLLNDGEADAPSAVRRSPDSPRNLFSRPELASELLSLVSDFESRLMQLVDKSKESESADEHKRFTTAVGHVVTELGDRFLFPVYRRHKELVPEALKGELL